MSEADINRWQDTITPREKAPQPWTIGSGGSWDMQEVQPIPDSMLAELAKLYHSHGCPWNCRSLPLSPSDREYMYLLYFSMQGLVARMRLAEKKAADCEARCRSLAAVPLAAPAEPVRMTDAARVAQAMEIAAARRAKMEKGHHAKHRQLDARWVCLEFNTEDEATVFMRTVRAAQIARRHESEHAGRTIPAIPAKE